MAPARPSFDEAIAFWRELLRSRGMSDRLAWVFAEGAQQITGASETQHGWRPHSSGAGEWLVRRAYRLAPAGDTLAFATHASADGLTIAGLHTSHPNANEGVRRDDWNLLFNVDCRLQTASHQLFSAGALREQMSADEHRELRRTALQDLVLLTSPLSTVQHTLKDLTGKSPDVWMLDKQHVLSILRRFEQDDIAPADVEAWANAIELCDDIGYDRETAVWDVLYELANPTLTEPLTRERADVLASVLKGH